MCASARAQRVRRAVHGAESDSPVIFFVVEIKRPFKPPKEPRMVSVQGLVCNRVPFYFGIEAILHASVIMAS